MLSGYFNGIPRELDDAAKVDGCSPLGALIRVILPAARPGLVAVAIYSFMTAWGEVLFASVMTTDANRTLTMELREDEKNKISHRGQAVAKLVDFLRNNI